VLVNFSLLILQVLVFSLNVALKDLQALSLGRLLLAQLGNLVLIFGILLQPSCQVLDWSLWLMGVDVGETAGDDLTDAVLLQVLQKITVHN
jgi:hypothetical protein